VRRPLVRRESEHCLLERPPIFFLAGSLALSSIAGQRTGWAHDFSLRGVCFLASVPYVYVITDVGVTTRVSILETPPGVRTILPPAPERPEACYTVVPLLPVGMRRRDRRGFFCVRVPCCHNRISLRPSADERARPPLVGSCWPDARHWMLYDTLLESDVPRTDRHITCSLCSRLLLLVVS